jgi:hypothetical protein
MKCHLFRAGRGNQMAITDDETGAKLPKREGAWIYVRRMIIQPMDGPRIGASSSEILSAIERDGYFILPRPI